MKRNEYEQKASRTESSRCVKKGSSDMSMGKKHFGKTP